MKIRYIHAICFLLFAPFVYGCENLVSTHVSSTQDSHKAWSTEDSWYKAPASGINWGNEKRFTDVKFQEVTGAMEPNAEKLLKQKSIVLLSLTQARTFTGNQFKPTKAKRPYLVRAVYLNKETGGFSVFLDGNKLIVSHDSLGHSAVPMKRQALVVSLSAQPAQVFVTCGMAE